VDVIPTAAPCRQDFAQQKSNAVFPPYIQATNDKGITKSRPVSLLHYKELGYPALVEVCLNRAKRPT
jgi:hypothetical protein